MPAKSFSVGALLFFTLVIVACSAKKGQGRNSDDAQATAQIKTATITGTVQVALGNGDVKNLVFTNVKLTQQGYSVLSDSEKRSIAFDTDEGIEAEKLGQLSMDDLSSKTEARTDAMRSFEAKLPEKEAVQGVITTTDASGNFKFGGLQPGTYWLLLDTQLAGNYVGWSFKIAIQPGATAKVDLSNTNIDYTFR